MKAVEEDPDFVPESGGSLQIERFPGIKIDVPKGAVIRTTPMSLQILPVLDDITDKLPSDVVCSPVVTLCPTRRMLRKFFKLSVPFPKEHLDITKENIKCFIKMSRVDEITPEWEDIGKNVRMTSNPHSKVVHVSSKLCGSYWIFVHPKSLGFDVKAVNFIFDSIRVDRDVKMNKATKDQLNKAISTDPRTSQSESYFNAARVGDSKRLKQILDSGEAKIEDTEEHTGWTALHIACMEGHTDIVKECIERGSDLNYRTKKGNTPLHLAAIFQHSEVAKLLLDNQATTDLYSPAGYTPLHISIIYGNDEILTDILQYDHSTNLYTESGQTARELAVQYNRKTTIAIMLVHLSNRAKHKNVEALKELVTVIEDFEKNESKDNQFADAFHLASNRMIKCIHAEIQKEIDNIQKTEDVRIKTYLVSAYTGNLQSVHDFVHQRRIEEVVSNKEDLVTGLHCACLGGHEDIVHLLLKHHHPVDCQTLTGYTPLFYAARSNSISIVDLLMEHGADIHIKNKMGCTAWLYAKVEKNKELAALLSSLKAKKLELAKTEKFKSGNFSCSLS